MNLLNLKKMEIYVTSITLKVTKTLCKVTNGWEMTVYGDSQECFTLREI